MRLTTGYGEGGKNIDHAVQLPEEQRRRLHGCGTWHLPGEITAGEPVTVHFTFEFGHDGLPLGGNATVAWRWPYDWSALQATEPSELGYVSWTAQGPDGTPKELTFEATYYPYAGIEPYHHYLEMKLVAGEVLPGDRLQIVCGDTSGGSAGWRAPTCAVREADFLMLIDPTGQGQWTELVSGGPFTIQPNAPARMVIVSETDMQVGQSQRTIIRIEDAWGNPTRCPQQPELTDAAGQESLKLEEMTWIDWPPVYHATISASQAGLFRLHGRLASLDIEAESNPIRVHETLPEEKIFWGDVHSGQSLIGCGAGTLAEHYQFGRDAAGLQIITHQANDHYVTVADWKETKTETEKCHAPHQYIPFLGCEWSPYTPDGGDRNVFYRDADPPLKRSARFFTEEHPDPEPDIARAPEFLAAFKDENVLINMHVGGRTTNLQWHEGKIETLAEIQSTHGTTQWFIEDCLRRGYRVGITGGSDGVMGRPGACRPGSRLIRNVANGVTAFLAKELTRESVWEAMQQRRCYATTGPRMLLDFSVDGHAMGTECDIESAPSMKLDFEGTAAVECVDLMCGTEVIEHWEIAEREREGKWIRLMFCGTTTCGPARPQRAVWDAKITVAGGMILEAQELNFQCPMDSVQQVSPNTLRFQTLTAGNEIGLLLRIDGPTDTEITIETELGSLAAKLCDAQQEAVVVHCGGHDRRIVLDAVPDADGPRHVELAYEDDEPRSGFCPYWVRVTQVDRQKAWSTPVYVTRA